MSGAQRRGPFSGEHELQSMGLYGQPVPRSLPPEPSPYPEEVLAALPQNNRKAFVALTLGLVSLALGLVTGLPAIIYGHLAYSEIKRSGGRQNERIAALIGLALGYCSLPLSALYIVLLLGR
jgi:hypothetical protein